MTDSRRFFLLDGPLPAAEIPQMMCRVVSDKRLPLFKYAPYEPVALASGAPETRHNTNDIIPGILSPPSRTTGAAAFLQTVSNQSLHTSLASLLGLTGGHGAEQRVGVAAAEVRRYTLSNPARVFDALMADPGYAADVRDLLKTASFGKAYLVVGFLTASGGARWTRTARTTATAGAEVTIPAAALAGVPLPVGLDVGVGASSERTIAGSTAGVTIDEEIFAVAYAVVRVRYSLGRHGITRTEVVGPPKRAKAGHLAFSGSDEEDDEEDGLSNDNAVQAESKPAANDVYLQEDSQPISGPDAERSFDIDW